MNLLIVESPNKISKISSLLGPAWRVAASVGHIRDLPKKDLGIAKENGYRLLYEISSDKKSVVEKLRKDVAYCGSHNVYLATDPDREGEAIAFHLCQALSLDYRTTKRVTFQEITATAVQAAVAAPRLLDLHLVAAQECRRALDRLVGYQISPVLWKKLEKGLSAGRVQSVALRMVVERERLITSFAEKFLFPVRGTFVTAHQELLTARRTAGFETAEDVKAYLLRAAAERYTVQEVEKKPVERRPPPPYSTSSLQQDGVRKLKLTVKQVMELAQRLFEEGHITYMRTDSLNLSAVAIAEARHQISTQYGPDYFYERHFKSKAGAQEAHEAIRPTHWENAIAGSSEKEKALYQLIYSRALASQMAAARYDETKITLTSPLPNDTFLTSTRVLTFEGYLKAYQDAEEDTEESDEASPMLRHPVRPGDVLAVERVEARQTYAKPPKRFDEASLVAELEKKQIGRPSTYAAILSNIQKRDYISPGSVKGKMLPGFLFIVEAGKLQSKPISETLGADKNKLLPTEKGSRLVFFLEKNFASIVEYDFTSDCEESFDLIAKGFLTYKAFVSQFDNELMGLLDQVETAYQDVATAARIELGLYQNLPVVAGHGKHGPYLLWNEQYFKLGEQDTLESLTEPRAGQLVAAGLERKQLAAAQREKSLIATVGKYSIREGKFGFYVTDGTTSASFKSGTTLEQVQVTTAQDCAEMIKNYKASKKRRSRRIS